jgi:hypothetical protein
MEPDKKKITAAIAAVTAYLQEEAAAAAQAAMAPETPGAAFREPAGYVRPWAANGRQTMMQVRNLMQLRMFTR